MGTKAATMVAAAASAALLVVLITFLWGRCSDGFFTKSRTLELGLSLYKKNVELVDTQVSGSSRNGHPS